MQVCDDFGLKMTISFRSQPFPSLPIKLNPSSKQVSTTSSLIVQNHCLAFDLNHPLDSLKLKHIHPHRIVVKIDPSQEQNKTITDPLSLQASKYLFHYELARSLAKSFHLLARPSTEYVDVFFSGYVFRLVITLNRELPLLRKSINSEDKVAKAELDQLEFDTQVAPTVYGCIQRWSQEMGHAYSMTTRLVKRWMSLMMIKGFFNDITIDLMVGHVMEEVAGKQGYPVPG